MLAIYSNMDFRRKGGDKQFAVYGLRFAAETGIDFP